MTWSDRLKSRPNPNEGGYPNYPMYSLDFPRNVLSHQKYEIFPLSYLIQAHPAPPSSQCPRYGAVIEAYISVPDVQVWCGTPVKLFLVSEPRVVSVLSSPEMSRTAVTITITITSRPAATTGPIEIVRTATYSVLQSSLVPGLPSTFVFQGSKAAARERRGTFLNCSRFVTNHIS